MTAAHRKRLLLLAEFLRTKVPEDRFKMHYWVAPGWKGSQTLSCGTSACALGWAATVPALRRAGLRLVRGDWDIWDNVPLVGWRNPRTGRVLKNPEEAAARVFGLDGAGFTELFADAEFMTPTEKADQIEAYVRRTEGRVRR